MDRTAVVAGGILEVGALALAVGVWRGREHAVRKVLWTLVLLVPAVGIIAFALLHDPPAPSDPIDRPPDRPDMWGPLP